MRRIHGRTAFARVQPAIAAAATQADEASLTSLAAQTGLSAGHLHRLFSTVAGETPKQFTLRLRLSRAAALLLTTDRPVLQIALATGFRSHEAFTRAFRRRFGMAPKTYRARGFVTPAGARDRARHRDLVEGVAPCVGLFHFANSSSQGIDVPYDVVQKDLTAQPVLVARRRVKRADIAATIGAVLPGIFQYAQERGVALAGHPFTRYIEMGPGMVTMEPGMRVTGGPSASSPTPSVPGVAEDVLPAGTVAMTVHAGEYETLSHAYAAIEEWIDSHGFERAGAPWEAYVTDPAAHPDPKDWLTEVFWPIRKAR